MEEAEENALWLIIITVLHFLCISVLGCLSSLSISDFVIFNSDLSQLPF